MFILGDDYFFPSTDLTSETGILAIGGDLHPDRLIEAYKHGIFPWYNAEDPIIWHSPEYRMVLFPSEVHISKSMRKVLRSKHFRVTYNQNFAEVIRHCKTVKRTGQDGTWLNDDLENAMLELHNRGIAKSVEVWQDDKLVGGLYGLDFGTLFCGESMFSLVSNASKVAFISLAQKLEKENYPLLDCQVYNDHLDSLGAVEISRVEFEKYLPK
jgi:leucyl/phenylalanyl-tRNA--protein transferase